MCQWGVALVEKKSKAKQIILILIKSYVIIKFIWNISKVSTTFSEIICQLKTI